MDFTLHQLYVFGMVARFKSITRAANELHMTQPAVSIQVKKLQNSIDIPLIEIIGRKLYLTEAGEYLYELYKTVYNELEAFDAQISQLKGGLKGSLTITAASTAKYFLPYLLGEFQKRYPKVEIFLKVTNHYEVLNHLENNEYNLAILTQIPDDETLVAIPFMENPLLMCAPYDHPLANKKNLNIEDLKDDAFIYREFGSGTRMVMEAYLKKHNIHVKPTMELGTNEAIKQAIMAGIGISLISELSLQNESTLKRIRILDVKDLPIMTHWHILYRNDKKVTPVSQNFISFLQNENLYPFLPYVREISK
ncbi:MAG TPA: LysR family transcriptional regulator [Balneolales bacterium]|nr:LysR family transcriptional regulator [Balneolales bacterium]